jgi:ParB-like chromosome segregation protein Spo0J
MKNEYLKLDVQKLPLAKLLPHPRNARRHPDPGSPEWDTLRASLEHDYFDPIVWNKRNGLLVSGHLRTKVLSSLGVKFADCVVVDYDEDTHMARMIAANKQIGDWDFDEMARQVEELGDKISLSTLSDDEVVSIIAQLKPALDEPAAPAPAPAGNQPAATQSPHQPTPGPGVIHHKICPHCGKSLS